jgi:hypothetical protein
MSERERERYFDKKSSVCEKEFQIFYISQNRSVGLREGREKRKGGVKEGAEVFEKRSGGERYIYLLEGGYDRMEFRGRDEWEGEER